MVLNIAATLFVLALTFLNSIYGLFSGLINLFCVIAATAVAFGFQEPLNDWLTGSMNLHSSYTEPFALVLPFFITLLALRMASDNLIRGNVRVPMYLDWGGGGLCGFISSQICVGVMVLGLTMMPWGGRCMMHQPFERNAKGRTYAEARNVDPELRRQDARMAFSRNRLWFRSDEFAAAVGSMLSNGSLRGEQQFETIYPDYVEWIAWSGNQVQNESLTAPLRTEDRDGFENSIAVESWWDYGDAQRPLSADYTQYRKVQPTRDRVEPPFDKMTYEVQDGNKLIGVRLTLMRNSADFHEDMAHHRFRPSVIRIVGDIRNPDSSLDPVHYIPDVLGGICEDIKSFDPKTDLRIVDIDTNISLGSEATIDAFFEVDVDFEPRFIEYRRHARVQLPPMSEEPPSDRATGGSSGGGGTSSGRPSGGSTTASGGPTSFVSALINEQTGDNDSLPFRMDMNKLTEAGVDVPGGKLAGVPMGQRIKGRRADYAGRGPTAIRKFQIPSGSRIFQVQTRPKRMKSLAGQVLNFVTSRTNVYRAIDEQGNPHPLAGYYALVKRGNDDYFEFFFTPNPLGEGFNGMLQLDNPTRKELEQQEDAILGLIFVVPNGTCITKIDPGGGKDIEFPSPECVER